MKAMCTFLLATAICVLPACDKAKEHERAGEMAHSDGRDTTEPKGNVPPSEKEVPPKAPDRAAEKKAETAPIKQ